MQIFHTPFIVLFLLSLVAQVWCADNMQVTITVTINTSPTINNAITIDSNGDGYLDQIQLNFDQLVSVNDSLGGADGLSGIVLSDSYQIVPGNYSASGVMSLTLNLIPKLIPDTGVTPIVSFATNVGTFIVSDATGLPMYNHSIISTDGAAPVLMSAESSVGSNQVILRLSEPSYGQANASGPINFSTISYTNNSGNAGPSALNFADADASDLLFVVQLDSPLSLSDFNSDTLSISSNGIYDQVGIDAVNTTRVLRLIDNTAPTIVSIETRDRDNDGYIDAILLGMSENIDDTTINPNNFIINGTGTLSLGMWPGEFINDGTILLTFSDGLLLSGLTPQTSYNAGSLRDLFNNSMLDQSPTNALDRAGPAIISASTRSINTIRIILSEAIDDSSLDANDFFFNGFLSSSGNGYGFAVSTGATANDNEVIVTLPGNIGPDETGIVSFDSPHVTMDLPGNWNEQNTGVAVSDGNPDTGTNPFSPFAPRIVSEANLWTLEAEEWSYEVEVDVRELVAPGHLGMLPQFDLQYQLAGTIPTGMQVIKTGALTARITWPRAAGNNEHIRITLQVSDTPSTTQDQQDVLIYVVDQPSAGN